MPSRSSFLLAFDRQERGEEEELENWVFFSLFSRTAARARSPPAASSRVFTISPWYSVAD